MGALRRSLGVFEGVATAGALFVPSGLWDGPVEDAADRSDAPDGDDAMLGRRCGDDGGAIKLEGAVATAAGMWNSSL